MSRHPELIHPCENHQCRPIGIHPQSVSRIGGWHDKPALGDTQEIVFPHQPLHPFAVDLPFAGFELRGNAPASITRPLQRDLLDLVP